MLGASVDFAAPMKFTSRGMTMRYVEVALTNLQRGFQEARSKPRHLVPQPKTSSSLTLLPWWPAAEKTRDLSEVRLLDPSSPTILLRRQEEYYNFGLLARVRPCAAQSHKRCPQTGVSGQSRSGAGAPIASRAYGGLRRRVFGQDKNNHYSEHVVRQVEEEILKTVDEPELVVSPRSWAKFAAVAKTAIVSTFQYIVRNSDNHMAHWKVVALISGNIEAVSGPPAQHRPGAHEWIVWAGEAADKAEALKCAEKADPRVDLEWMRIRYERDLDIR